MYGPAVRLPREGVGGAVLFFGGGHWTKKEGLCRLLGCRAVGLSGSVLSGKLSANCLHSLMEKYVRLSVYRAVGLFVACSVCLPVG